MTMKVLIRVDAGSEAGYGHFMRSLALAQALRRHGHDAVMISRTLPVPLRDDLRRLEFLLRELPLGLTPQDDAAVTQQEGLRDGCRWIVTDGTRFDPGYRRLLMEGSGRLLSIDDLACGPDSADIVLNQNHGVGHGESLSLGGSAVFLAGCDYVLLRESFLKRRAMHLRERTSVRNILVTMGAADLGGETVKTLEALAGLSQYEWCVRVVVGDVNPHGQEIRRRVDQLGGRFECVGSSTDLAPLMEWADLAIGAAGSTCWEMAFVGLPMFVVTTAENQRYIGRALHNAGCAYSLGRHEEVTASGIAESLLQVVLNPGRLGVMSRQAAALVDGRGADRVVAVMERVT